MDDPFTSQKNDLYDSKNYSFDQEQEDPPQHNRTNPSQMNSFNNNKYHSNYEQKYFLNAQKSITRTIDLDQEQQPLDSTRSETQINRIMGSERKNQLKIPIFLCKFKKGIN